MNFWRFMSANVGNIFNCAELCSKILFCEQRGNGIVFGLPENSHIQSNNAVKSQCVKIITHYRG
jgi:uncharacterized Fe-S cluster protein YjdI